MKIWLADRLQKLLPVLAVLGVAQEQEIQQLCELEIAAWRARPQMKEPTSLRVPMTDTRNAIKALPVTETNRWLNPRTQEREHIALKYMNFSEEEWAAMNAATERDFRERLETQQLVEQPEAVIVKADSLLGSQRWEEIVVGLAVVTGRRLTEVLKTGELHPMSQYTVVFSGQLKRKDEKLDPYEIPTLVEATRVLDAWKRVHALVDCTRMENDEVSAAYSRVVGEVAKRAFHGLVPVRSNDEDIYTHLFRTVYARLAVWLYCPVQVTDLTYMATIQGHYWVLKAETEEKRRNYMSTLHYMDYAIGDGAGNIDGRHGIALGKTGVKVLDAFQAALTRKSEQETRRQEKAMTLPMHSSSQTGYGLLKPRQQTKTRFTQVQTQMGLTTDEALSVLLDEHALYWQFLELLKPIAAQSSTAQPLETLQVLLAAFARQQTESQAFEARWHITLDEVGSLLEQVAATGETQPLSMLKSLVEKRQHQRQKHVQRRQETEYELMPFSALKDRKEPEAAEERFRRAVAAIMHHNEGTDDPLHRWYINASSVMALVGGRRETIQASLDAHHDEIQEHHDSLHITELSNRKGGISIAKMVRVPEEPSVQVNTLNAPLPSA